MITLIESTRRDGVMRKGEWKHARRSSYLPRSVVSVSAIDALVCCPGCGKICTLTDHTIDPDGTVTPSLVCPFKCDFHEYVKLADWKA